MCAQLYESNQPSKHYNKIRAAVAQYSRIMPVELAHPGVRTKNQLDRGLHEIKELVTSSCWRALRSAQTGKTQGGQRCPSPPAPSRSPAFSAAAILPLTATPVSC